MIRERRRKAVGAGIGLIVGVLIVLQAVTLVNVLQTVQRIEDCTEPTGQCYEHSTQRTQQAVVGINEGTLRVVVAVVSCRNDGHRTQRSLTKCTLERTRVGTTQ